MADLVETVARAVDQQAVYSKARKRCLRDFTSNGIDHHIIIVAAEHAARAAIAAVLNDMAEPSAGMIDAVRRLGSASVPKVWQAMLAQYRKEMG